MNLVTRRARLKTARFYAILDTGYVPPDHLYAVAEQIVRGGVDLIQFRAKGMGREEVVRMGQGLREIIPAIDAATPGPLFVLNDHPGLVEEIGADGVHVGQDDLSVETAREQAGAEILIGKSTHSLEQAIVAEKEGPDYIGVGPLFATPTKPDYVPVGLDLIGQVAAQVGASILHRRRERKNVARRSRHRCATHRHRFRSLKKCGHPGLLPAGARRVGTGPALARC